MFNNSWLIEESISSDDEGFDELTFRILQYGELDDIEMDTMFKLKYGTQIEVPENFRPRKPAEHNLE